jgi:hypothetical protein
MNSHGYSEEFISFINGNSQFQIDVKHHLYANKIIKIDNNDIINNFSHYNVFTFSQLSEVLDNAKGGEIIIVRRNLREKNLHYRQKHPYARPVLILGMLDNNKAPFLDNIIWENLNNITISHFKINNLRAKNRFSYSWQIRNSNKVRLSNLYFRGKRNNLVALKKNDIGTILNSQSGLFIKQSNDIVIDRTLFSDLFHAVEFKELNSFYAIANKSVRIASDMFSGGGVNNALFDSNLSQTRTPVYFTRWGKRNYVHSDMIQLYTTKMKSGNTNITIRNNISLVGDSPLANPNLSGWQCFFTRDESGDHSRRKNLLYDNIKIINNICALNQHHGVTLSRGHDNVVAGNLVLLVDQGKTNRQASGSIKIFDNKDCKILGNVTNKLEFRNVYNCQNINNIYNYKPDYQQTINKIRYAVKSAKQRTVVEPASSSNDLSRYYKNSSLQDHPLQFLDYSKFTLVPSF